MHPLSVAAVTTALLGCLPGALDAAPFASSPGPIEGAPTQVAAPSNPTTAAPSARPFRFGTSLGELEGLDEPADAAFGPDGTLYVVDRDNHRIAGFRSPWARIAADPGGRLAPDFSFGSFGSGPGEFRFPEGIATDANGWIFVSDTGNHRVQVFDRSGGFIRQWGERGSKREAFNRPLGIAADSIWVYVADSGNDRVQVFDKDGRFVTILGGPGSGEGGLRRPTGVAVDRGDTVVIADSDNNRIVVFDKAGRFRRHWGDFGPFAGLLDAPTGVTLFGGDVFVADTRNHRVQVFDSRGAFLREWGDHARVPREGAGRLHYPAAVAVAPDGSMAAIVEPFEDRVQLFSALAPGEEESRRVPIPPDEQTHFGKRLGVDGGLLAIPEPESHLIDVFDMRGEAPVLITRFGERGTRFGQFRRLGGVVVDASTKRIMATDEAERRIQTFQLDWDPAAAPKFAPLMSRFIRALSTSTEAAPFARAGWPMTPEGMRRDGRGRTLVTDRFNRMIFVYDREMSPSFSIASPAAGTAQIREPTDAVVGVGADRLFVVDAGSCQIVAFDPRGNQELRFGGHGDGAGRFRRPFGIAGGRDGFVYVTDEAGHRIVKFTENGRFVTEWGRKGTADGELWKPAGIEQLPDGRLVVIDFGNHRAQVFEPDGTWVMTFGGGRVATRDRPAPADPAPALRED
ncbi:MAG TPA: NHL repeat-containing protein [Phycisphaerales bacterium]|nr:NHL repeat-containing protein [Phycisphaerales bacterium]HMP38689.1 NHL repeat-containing protein [Phycisphaerales bacterium]